MGMGTIVDNAEALDVEALDDYFLQALWLPVDNVLQRQYLPKSVQDYYAPLLRSIVGPLVTLLLLSSSSSSYNGDSNNNNTRTATPASQALGLQLQPKPQSKNKLPYRTDFSFQLRLVAYAMLSFGVPQVYRRVKKMVWSLLEHRQQGSLSLSSISPRERLARERQTKVVQRFFQTLDTIVPMLRLACLLSCWNGRLSSPSLGMLLTGLDYTSTTPSGNTTTTSTSSSSSAPSARPLHVLYAHRRWLHQEGVQRLLPILWTPLMQSVRETQEFTRAWIQRALLRPLQHTARSFLPSSRQHDASSKNNCCSVCQTDTIVVVPYQTNCGHVYCYTCLWNHLFLQRANHKQSNNNHDPTCCSCQAPVTSCRPVP